MNTVNLIGEMIILRAMEPEDMRIFCEMVNDPYIESMVGGWSFPISQFEQARWFEKVFNDKRNLRFTIVSKKNGEILGMANLKDIDWKNRVAFHGIKLAPNAEKGIGYGKDTVMTLMKYAFEELQLNRLDGAIIEYNHASMSLYKKCGWKIEGTRRQAIYKNDSYHDNILVGILKTEYYDIMSKING